MEFPPLTSYEGAYWYLISAIVVLSAVLALYVAAVSVGVAPDPSRILP